MKRLIYKEDALSFVREYIDEYDWVDENGWHTDKWCAMKEAESVIEKLPEIDARPVILCRDCVHYEMGACLKIYDDGNVSADAWQERKPDDFCSYAEDRNNPPEMTRDLWED